MIDPTVPLHLQRPNPFRTVSFPSLPRSEIYAAASRMAVDPDVGAHQQPKRPNFVDILTERKALVAEMQKDQRKSAAAAETDAVVRAAVKTIDRVFEAAIEVSLEALETSTGGLKKSYDAHLATSERDRDTIAEVMEERAERKVMGPNQLEQSVRLHRQQAKIMKFYLRQLEKDFVHAEQKREHLTIIEETLAKLEEQIAARKEEEEKAMSQKMAPCA
ncbi:hypothetical protein B0H12DRAFT_362625 [Mycena haematopus]|nr:hypothetical protein B0H12DRAFT_362625 [Mycena haematopus]